MLYKDLNHRVAVITGGSKGIGAAIAKRFGQEHMAVVINYNRDAQGAQQAAQQVEQNGGQAVIVQADVATQAGNQALLQAALDHFGDLDVWVNNAGMEVKAPTHELSLADWNRVIAVDQTGVFLGAQTALAYFKRQNKKGNIINLSSVHEQIPWPTFASYAAAKGGSCLPRRLRWNMPTRVFGSTPLVREPSIHPSTRRSLLIRMIMTRRFPWSR